MPETCEEVLRRYGLSEEKITHRPHAYFAREDEVNYNDLDSPSTVDPTHTYEWDNTVIIMKAGAA